MMTGSLDKKCPYFIIFYKSIIDNRWADKTWCMEDLIMSLSPMDERRARLINLYPKNLVSTPTKFWLELDYILAIYSFI